MKRQLILLVLILFTLNLVLSAHYIIGDIEDALDGEPANGKIIFLWNPENGQQDNLTDIIGPSGNSNADNIYMIDCELLQTPCKVGDTLNLKVLNTQDDYTSQTTQLTVQAAGYSVADTIRLNSPPQVNLVTPQNNYNVSGNIEFNCSFNDLDNNAQNITLWGNWTGQWLANETKTISAGQETYKTFNKFIQEGTYKWACQVTDNLSISRFATENRTFTSDLTPPIITSITPNQTEYCGQETIRVNCTTYDELLNIDTVIIQLIYESGEIQNHTANHLSGNTYFADITLNKVEQSVFNCIANDTVGNTNNLTSTTITGYSDYAELELTTQNIFFNTTPQNENQPIEIKAKIINKGCLAANNFVIGFFKGDKDQNGINLENKTISIPEKSYENVSITWLSEIGLTNIFIYADLEEIIYEENKTNNHANKTIYLRAWQEIFGNITSNKLLSDSLKNNITFWGEHKNFTGNIFITHPQATINWYNLQALGKDINNQPSPNDFNELDIILEMTQYNDSIENIFTNSGTPKQTTTITLFNYKINNVPIINSTTSGNFITGILWDTTKNTNQNFDATDKEDIVFVTTINQQKQGKYGIYDYEITIPSKLREYYQSEQTEVFLYYEIV